MNGSQLSENTWKQKLKSIHEASSDFTYGRNLPRKHITIRLSNLSLLAVIFWLNNIKLERISVLIIIQPARSCYKIQRLKKEDIFNIYRRLSLSSAPWSDCSAFVQLRSRRWMFWRLHNKLPSLNLTFTSAFNIRTARCFTAFMP